MNDSIEGRFLTPDPLSGDIGNPQSLNRYAYVLNNPTSLTDPLGLAPPAGETFADWLRSCSTHWSCLHLLAFGVISNSYLAEEWSQKMFDQLGSVAGPPPGFVPVNDQKDCPGCYHLPGTDKMWYLGDQIANQLEALDAASGSSWWGTAANNARLQNVITQVTNCPAFANVGRNLQQLSNTGHIRIDPSLDAAGDTGGLSPTITLNPDYLDPATVLHEWVHTTQIRANPLYPFLKIGNAIQARFFSNTSQGFLDNSAEAVAQKIVSVCGIK